MRHPEHRSSSSFRFLILPALLSSPYPRFFHSFILSFILSFSLSLSRARVNCCFSGLIEDGCGEVVHVFIATMLPQSASFVSFIFDMVT